MKVLDVLSELDKYPSNYKIAFTYYDLDENRDILEFVEDITSYIEQSIMLMPCSNHEDALTVTGLIDSLTDYIVDLKGYIDANDINVLGVESIYSRHDIMSICFDMTSEYERNYYENE